MEIPRLGVTLELQLPACATATATPDPSHVCNLHHSSRQRRILKPLSKARDRTRNLVIPSQFVNHWAMTQFPLSNFKNSFFMEFSCGIMG